MIGSSDRREPSGEPGDPGGPDTGGRRDAERADPSATGDDHEPHNGLWRKRQLPTSDVIVKVAIVAGTLIGAASLAVQLVH